MELRFDRLMIQPDTNVPINARVVAVPKYPVDSEGRIHGTGHPVRDTIEWLIPVLWPIDLINLPRRGPRPTLKPETQLTLKVLDDFGIPSQMEQDYQQPALIERRAAAIEQHKENLVDQGYMTADEAFGQQSAPAQQQYAPAPVQQSYAPQQQYARSSSMRSRCTRRMPQPQPQVIVVQSQPQTVYVPQPVYVQAADVLRSATDVLLRSAVLAVLDGHEGRREKASRDGRPSFVLLLRSSYFLASTAAAYLRRKRSTRPAVSTSFCLPVKNGWQAEQISRTMSPLWVERVSKWLPQAQRTLVFSYLGWMPSLGMV